MSAFGGIRSLGALLELNDPYIDPYFRLPLDLSRAYFICVMNTGPDGQPPALLPHLENRLGTVVHTDALSYSDKVTVATRQGVEALRNVGYASHFTPAAIRQGQST